MKKTVLFLLTLMFVLTACAPVAATFVPLPDTEKLGITAVVVALVSFIFGWVGTKLPWTVPLLTRFKEEITVALSALVVGVVENALPGAYPEISILVVQLVLAALATIGIFKTFAKFGLRKPAQVIGQ